MTPGPSPRARGTLPRGRRQASSGGTIPACAGNTRTGHAARRTAADHPRVRGEHYVFNACTAVAAGPSPRARGTPGGDTPCGAALGTIPACAGNTVGELHGRTLAWDHPRVRGEHAIACAGGCAGWGPSPRARGTHSATPIRPVTTSTIPACAGNTLVFGILGLLNADHPRVRGEHTPSGAPLRSGIRPSPRARGTHRTSCRRLRPRPTIPACAGNTPKMHNVPDQGTDHPRVRGEHTLNDLHVFHGMVRSLCTSWEWGIWDKVAFCSRFLVIGVVPS